MLVAEAKKALVSVAKATKLEKGAVEAPDPLLVNELLAERALLVEQIRLLTAQKSEIEAVVKDAIGKQDSLWVHGAKVASVARWRETRVLSDVVKEMFAVADFPELYKRESKSRLTIH